VLKAMRASVKQWHDSAWRVPGGLPGPILTALREHVCDVIPVAGSPPVQPISATCKLKSGADWPEVVAGGPT
jgi:hypothetical protein